MPLTETFGLVTHSTALIWEFNTQSKNYSSFIFPKTTNQSESFPQMLKPDGSDIMVNDFTGKKVAVFSTDQNW